MANSNEEVVVVVSPRSKGGVSLFEPTVSITADNVHEFHSEASDIAAASNELRKLGFRVLQEGPVTISIAGSRKLLQDVLGAKLRKQKTEIMEGQEVEFYAVSGEPAEQLLEPPEELSNLIEGAAVAQPPELFESPLPPIAPPDPAAYRYLFVPDEVALVLRATRIHRLGTTGRDVVVAMIDTGHYAHPFFNWHGYRVMPTLLGPGQADPSQDNVGHGTGESANIFAAAPDIRLRPVKGLVDPTGDFNVAVASTPTPQIITNSWGYDIDYPGTILNPYLMTLEAAVANAVASGIVVCFSAGNKTKQGFPASHPDVIAVGGVHVNYPNLDLEASSYASSFDSSLYPGRHVPDVCGLVGNQTAAGSAPLIMLPVQPGSGLDLSNTGSTSDGWGIFSGTSAACPQTAGVVALLLEKDATLTPAQIKSNLVNTARDVTVGTSANGDTAGPGWDAATGAGLVDAKWAWIIAMGDVTAQFFEASPDKQAAMIEAGQVPRIPRGFVLDLMDTLRSR